MGRKGVRDEEWEGEGREGKEVEEVWRKRNGSLGKRPPILDRSQRLCSIIL